MSWNNTRTLPTVMLAVAVVAAAAALTSWGASTGAPGPPAGLAASAASGADRCDQPGPHDLPHLDEPVDLDPADFTSHIDNRFWPMRPGTRWVYRETDTDGSRQRVEVIVTPRTRNIAGIEARVVHDVVTERGQLVENTFDWYAQDAGGSVWYLGEFSREYEDGKVVGTEGSWEHGVGGALGGVLVPARPQAGCSFRQEYLQGEAEDRARTLSTRDDIEVNGERYRDVWSTSDRVPTEPFVLEHKFYAEGVGPVLAIEVSPGAAREVLLGVRVPGR